jgi:MFS family permease
MLSVGSRFGMLLIAAALLFVAIRMNKSSNKKAKHASIVTAFLAGLFFLGTIVGGWITGADWLTGLGVAGLLVCACIIAVDWLADKKPDKPALYAAFALPLFIILGAASLPAVGGQIADSGHAVTEQMSQMGK